MANRILIIEDDKNESTRVYEAFVKGGWESVVAEDIQSAKKVLLDDEFEPHVVLADVGLPDGNLLDRLEELQRETDFCEWIFVTDSDQQSVFERIDELAYEYIIRPIDQRRLDTSCRRALRAALTQFRLKKFSQEQTSRYTVASYLGKSKAIAKVRYLISQLKDVPLSTMIITGETGTGKGLTAGIVHHSGHKKNGPFVELNCAALPRELLESQLFGHEAGAFTGAKSRHKGLFEQADGGTLFLDEIGDMDLELQAKLLKAIEEQKIRRLGSEKEISVDVQIIAATGIDLERAVVEGEFRDDLFHRLSVFCIELPTLRERKDDLMELVPNFIVEFNHKANKKVDIIEDETWEILLDYDWPGNVRELRNVLERCVLLSKDEVLPREWLQLKRQIAATIKEGDSQQNLSTDGQSILIPLDGSCSLDDMEKLIIESALNKSDGNVAEAARLLKTTRQTLRYRIKKHLIS